MKKIIPIFVVILTVLFLVGCTGNDSDKDKEKTKTSFDPEMTCKMKDVSVAYLQGIADAGKIAVQITQEYVDKINSKPHCKDFCLQQLEYSHEYDDWFAEKDLRKTCFELGINLPK